MTEDINIKAEKRNVFMLVAKDSFLVLSQTLTSLSIVQAFLLTLGVNNFQLGMLNTFSNGALMLGMLLFMGRIDTLSMDKIISKNKKLLIFIISFPATLVFLYLTGNKTGNLAVFAIAAAGWSVQSFFVGIRIMTESKMYRNMFRPENYGFVFGLDGIVFNTLGMLAGFLIKPLLETSNGLNGFGTVFIISLFVLPGSFYFNRKLHVVRVQESSSGKVINNPISSFSYAFRNKVLRTISILHVVRGIINGMFFFILPMGIKHYNIPLSYSAFIVIVNAAAGIIGYLFISIFYDRIGTIKSILSGITMCFLALVGFIMTTNPLLFLLSVAFFVTGQTMIVNSVPLGVYKVTPQDFIGTFAGVRFFIMQTAEGLVALIMGIFIAKLSIVLFSILIATFLVLLILLTKQSFKKEAQDSLNHNI